MWRWILVGVLFVGCVPEPHTIKVSVSVTPISLSRPCFISKVAVFDHIGQEYHASSPDCNEAVIELEPGRAFVGVELESTEIEDISVYLVE